MAISQGPTFREVYRVDLTSPTGVRYELNSIASLSCSEGRQGEGDLTITFGMFANDIDPRALVATSGYGWTVSVSNRWQDRAAGATELPLWHGVVLRTRTGYTTHPVIELECEAMVHHLARRRLALAPTNAVTDFISVKAGSICSHFGSGAFASSVTFSPAYPWPGRNNFGPWSVAMGSVADGNTVAWQEQSGGNLWDIFSDVCERGDLAIRLSRAGPLAYLYNFDAPYISSDLSNQAVFSVANGTLKSVVKTVDFSSLANVYQARGSGKEAGQVSIWSTDAESYGLYGNFEDGSTNVATDNTTAITDEAVQQLRQLARPKVTWEADVVLSDEQILGTTFSRRSIVTLEHPLVGNENLSDTLGGSWSTQTGYPGRGEAVEEVVIGYRLSLESGFPKVNLVLGDVPYNWVAQLSQTVGLSGGRSGGGRRTNRGGW